ncbi:hypothetical protein RRG08_024491 [Elysia crispata]|uniref:Uncharacterized protein n=1 Tax=Elysia crispata TaxID=231223 RepID=A0AAE0YQ30_9GAST|nr:hypothetical protein RRG08_024491 [Elysia crispata]
MSTYYATWPYGIAGNTDKLLASGYGVPNPSQSNPSSYLEKFCRIRKRLLKLLCQKSAQHDGLSCYLHSAPR